MNTPQKQEENKTSSSTPMSTPTSTPTSTHKRARVGDNYGPISPRSLPPKARVVTNTTNTIDEINNEETAAIEEQRKRFTDFLRNELSAQLMRVGTYRKRLEHEYSEKMVKLSENFTETLASTRANHKREKEVLRAELTAKYEQQANVCEDLQAHINVLEGKLKGYESTVADMDDSLVSLTKEREEVYNKYHVQVDGLTKKILTLEEDLRTEKEQNAKLIDKLQLLSEQRKMQWQQEDQEIQQAISASSTLN